MLPLLTTGAIVILQQILSAVSTMLLSVVSTMLLSVVCSDYSQPICHYTSGTAPTQPDPPMLSEQFVTSLTVSWIRRPTDDVFILHMEDEATVSLKVTSWRSSVEGHWLKVIGESIFILIYIKATLVDRPQLGYIAKHAKEWSWRSLVEGHNIVWGVVAHW